VFQADLQCNQHCSCHTHNFMYCRRACYNSNLQTMCSLTSLIRSTFCVSCEFFSILMELWGMQAPVRQICSPRNLHGGVYKAIGGTILRLLITSVCCLGICNSTCFSNKLYLLLDAHT
jgi:hypothetical protein